MAKLFVAKVAGQLRYAKNAWPVASSTAVQNLGSAISSAAVGDEVIISKGTYTSAELHATTGTQVAKNVHIRKAKDSDAGSSSHIGDVVLDVSGLESYCMSVNSQAEISGLEFTGSGTKNPALRVNKADNVVFNGIVIRDVPFAFTNIGESGWIFNRSKFLRISGVAGGNSQMLDIRGVNANPKNAFFNYCLFEDCAGFIRVLEDSKITTVFNNCMFSGFSYGILKMLSSASTHKVKFVDCVCDGIALEALSSNVAIITNQAIASGGKISIKNSKLTQSRFWTGVGWPIAGVDDEGGNVLAPGTYVRHKKKGVVILCLDDWYKEGKPTPGSYPGQDPQYHTKFATMCEAKGWKCTIAVPVVGRSSEEWDEMAALAKRGHDLSSHSMSHPRLANRTAVTITYTGTGTAATAEKTGNILKTVITGDSGANLTLDLTNLATISDLKNAISGQSAKGYTCEYVQHPPTKTLSVNLADFSAQNIKGTVYTLKLDEEKFYEYELNQSKLSIEREVNNRYPELSYRCRTFIHPNDSTDETVRKYLAKYYDGARGQNKDNNYDIGAGVKIYGIFDAYLPQFFSDGDFNVLTDDQIKLKITSLCEWLNHKGGIIVIYAHQTSEVDLSKWQVILDTIEKSNVDVMTLPAAVDFLKTGTPSGLGGETKYAVTNNSNPDYHLTSKSLLVGAGSGTGQTYDFDMVPVEGTKNIGLYKTVHDAPAPPPQPPTPQPEIGQFSEENLSEWVQYVGDSIMMEFSKNAPAKLLRVQIWNAKAFGIDFNAVGK